MQKTGKSTATGMVVFLLVVMTVAIVAVAVNVLMKEQTPAATIIPQAIQTETGVQTVPAKVYCDSDGKTDGQVRYRDVLAATVTYGAPTCYFVPKTAGQERVTAGTLQTDGTYSTAASLPCVSSGTEWETVCVTDQDDYSSAVGSAFTAAGSFAKVDLEGKKADGLQFKVEDKFAGAATFFNTTGCGSNAQAGTQGYVAFNGTSYCTVTDAVGKTSLTIGADQYIDARIYLKSNSTKSQFGEDGLRVWMIVDAASNKWQEPVVGVGTGPTLVNKLSQLAAKDLEYYSGSEYAYEIGTVGDREIYIDYYQETAAGVNPSSSDLPQISFCAEGRYNSAKQQDTILVGCWSDATTQTQVAQGEAQSFKFSVS